MRKGRPWYFLTPSYWFSGGSRRMGKHAVRTSKGVRSLNPPLSRAALLDEGAQRDPDVLAEERRMLDLLHHRTGVCVGGKPSACRVANQLRWLAVCGTLTSCFAACTFCPTTQSLTHLISSAAGSGSSLSLAADGTNAVEVFGLQKVFSPACCGGRGCKGVCWCVAAVGSALLPACPPACLPTSPNLPQF